MIFFSKVHKIQFNGNLRALIVPHAGYIYSGPVAAYAYSLLKNFKHKKLKIILLGPSHYVHNDEAVCDDNDFWETPIGKVKIFENDFPKNGMPHMREHCLEVQIPFLQRVIEDFEILPLVAGDTNPKETSKKIIEILDKDTILIISTDLSHFFDYDTANKIDKNTIDAIKNLDYDKLAEEGDACGKIPILTAIDIAKKLNWKIRLLDYRNSGDTAGMKSSVVGYASFALYE